MRENTAFESFVRKRSGALLRTAYLLVRDRGHAKNLPQGGPEADGAPLTVSS